ncbi:MAG: hypothetical protein ACON34_04570 [Flavobacteriales bacterium]
MVLMLALAAAFASCRKEIVPMDDFQALIEADDRICGDDAEDSDDEADDGCTGGDVVTDDHGDDDGDDGINDGDGDDEDDEGGERRATH